MSETSLMGIARDQIKRRVFMQIACALAQLGTCDRKHVGAVIVRDGRCISWGFNGAPPGAPHCSENGHGWGYKHPPESGKVDMYELNDAALNAIKLADRPDLIPWDYAGEIAWCTDHFGCRNATHAEANALAFAAKQGISTAGGELFVTVSPCDTCSRLLIAAGIRRVYFMEEYRDLAGVELLRTAGISCVSILPATGGINL